MTKVSIRHSSQSSEWELSARKVEFAKRLTDLMERKKIDQHELSQRIGVTPSAIYSYRTGRVIPPRGRLDLIARALECDIVDLLPTKEIAEGTESPERHYVFLIQVPSVPRHTGQVRDISALNGFGEVSPLLERPDNPSYDPAYAIERIREKLSGFRPNRDYIAAAGGNNLGMILAGWALRDLGHRNFRYLHWEKMKLPGGKRDPERGSYSLVQINID